MQLALKAKFELVPRSQGTSFAVREFKLPFFQSPWHFHPEFELTYILQGRGKRFVGNHIASFGPGDLVLVGSNLPHFWHNEPPSHRENRLAHSLVVQFREDCLGADFLNRPELNSMRLLLQEAGRGLQFSGATRDRVASLLFAMADHSGMAQLIDFLSAFNLLAQAQASERSVLSSAGFVPSLDERAGKRINLAYEYVFAHFTRPPNYAEIARKTGMSLSAFCHYFKRVTGRTLSAFVCEVRIGHARKLLIETDEGIAEIAYASGFESLSNFNRCFRALTQLSPKEFRRQHRNHSGSQSCV